MDTRANEIITSEGSRAILPRMRGSVVARIERSEIRDPPACVARLPPGFAALNPGYRRSPRVKCRARRQSRTQAVASSEMARSLRDENSRKTEFVRGLAMGDRGMGGSDLVSTNG